MDPIAETFGSNRIVHGTAVTHPLAEPDDDNPEKEYEERKATVVRALRQLESKKDEAS